MSTRRALRLLAIPATFLGSGATPALAQCAMCNAAVDPGRAGRAFSLSVLFLLAVLFGLVGWLAALAVRSSSGR
jgi:hypothetical protein